jgi:tetratricopeptide (TPR) repeat protein
VLTHDKGQAALKPPTTPEEVHALHKLSKADPGSVVQITTDWIATDPSDSHAYYDRHTAWLRLGKAERAMADLNEAFRLAPSQSVLWARGDLHRQVGDYEHAAEDYASAEALDPEKWAEDAFPLIYQADVYARLGDEASALACCSRLPDDFWTPGHNDLPSGGKAEIAAELKRRASVARAGNKPA